LFSPSYSSDSNKIAQQVVGVRVPTACLFFKVLLKATITGHSETENADPYITGFRIQISTTARSIQKDTPAAEEKQSLSTTSLRLLKETEIKARRKFKNTDGT